MIFLHNHPSGDPEPSIDDIEITNRLCKSCSIIGINVLDHLIIAENGYFSFKQKNMLIKTLIENNLTYKMIFNNICMLHF